MRGPEQQPPVRRPHNGFRFSPWKSNPSSMVKSKRKGGFTPGPSATAGERLDRRSAGVRSSNPRELTLAVIEGLDDGLQEFGGGSAVNDPMVEGQAQRHHRAARDLAAVNRGPFDYPPQSQDRRFAVV